MPVVELHILDNRMLLISCDFTAGCVTIDGEYLSVVSRHTRLTRAYDSRRFSAKVEQERYVEKGR